MEELVKVNEDADFLNFISVEKDNMMIENSIRDEVGKYLYLEIEDIS